jgi:hypothetical protein
VFRPHARAVPSCPGVSFYGYSKAVEWIPAAILAAAIASTRLDPVQADQRGDEAEGCGCTCYQLTVAASKLDWLKQPEKTAKFENLRDLVKAMGGEIVIRFPEDYTVD